MTATDSSLSRHPSDSLTSPYSSGEADTCLRNGETLHEDFAKWETFFNKLETRLNSSHVLVTGGSGGIGSACVRLFAAEGARVVVHYNTGRERAEAAGGAAVVQADLTDEKQVDRMFAESGDLDICAAVAGIWPVEDVP